MRWVLSLWTSNDLALAIDPTMLSDRLCVIVVSVVYRGCAIPVAWVAMPANKPGEWIEPACEMLDPLSVAIPTTMRVIATTDRGLRSPNLWEKIQSYGWRPYMRQRINTTFRLDGGKRMPARRLVAAQWQLLHRARNGVQRQVPTAARDDNRHLGRGSERAVDYPDRPPAGGGRGVLVRDAFLDRNGVQCAEKRGLAVEENSANRPRAGGATLARPVGGDAADARLRQPGGRRPGAETESGRAAVASESGA